MSTDTIVALRSVHDYLKFHDLKAHEVEMTMYWQAAGRQERSILMINNQKPYLLRKQGKWKQEATSMRILK